MRSHHTIVMIKCYSLCAIKMSLVNLRQKSSPRSDGKCDKNHFDIWIVARRFFCAEYYSYVVCQAGPWHITAYKRSLSRFVATLSVSVFQPNDYLFSRSWSLDRFPHPRMLYRSSALLPFHRTSRLRYLWPSSYIRPGDSVNYRFAVSYDPHWARLHMPSVRDCHNKLIIYIKATSSLTTFWFVFLCHILYTNKFWILTARDIQLSGGGSISG
jgi:hypothetical protein